MPAAPGAPNTQPAQNVRTFLDRLWNADDKMLRWLLGLLIVVLACFNFLRDLNNPNHAFWDESYYLTSMQRYVEGTAQYASHPPLAFMFMDASLKLSGANHQLNLHPLAEVKKIDTRVVPAGYDFTFIRLPAALFAVVGALLFYLIILRLANEPFEAFVFSLLFVFENAYIVHFRAAQLDSYQMTFTLGSVLVWLYTFGREPKRPLLTYLGFGVLCGLSFMCKVNSVVMLFLGALSLLRALWMEQTRANFLRQFARGWVVLGGFFAVVVLIFSLHVVFNPNAPDPNTEAGKRDLHYMDQVYQDYLHHKRGLSPTVIWHATTGYYAYMKHDFTGEVKTEPNGSQPILWPFMAKVINYRWDFDGKRTAYTQMVGNPVNWGLGLIGIIGAAILVARRRFRNESPEDRRDLDLLEPLLAMYAVFMGVHIYLGLQRVMYIYHYFIGLGLSFMMVPLVFRLVARRFSFIDRHRFTILCAISLLIAGSYLFYAPLTYHQPMTRQACEARNFPVRLVVCQPVKTPHALPKPAS
ncbi:phospholipid carrier-dependent glycosyltransferase [Asticcacaulis sp. EMRT-3]|uniref:phospholipid carrier-dependent glycosyltransferase n=1 Tax=Asticcacaulis sp. EMRT-3 TaxID=3040349 RepID=UPI0024AF74CF|nr:phospholipid carrier-dependent glycosyltransferase [Asticcacaulis sp. EMRT-3]MDI7775048.1 phospholipid carrier-dependent glycosyltransferase [Asticcacaulis sp. EMRT-3]